MITMTIVGAFFIPYLLMAVFVGMPIFFLELAIGQFSSCGPVTAYRFCPLFAGRSTIYVHIPLTMLYTV